MDVVGRLRRIYTWLEDPPQQPEKTTMCISFAFLEMVEVSSADACWFTPVTVRTAIIQKIEGGFSRLLRDVLRDALLGEYGLVRGVDLKWGSPVHRCRLRARFGTLVGDGDGLRQALDWNGATGIKCCFRHTNVVSRRSRLGQRGDLVDVTCSDPARFKLAAPGELSYIQEMLVALEAEVNAGRELDARYTEVCQASGFKANPLGVMACPLLKPYVDLQTAVRYDWVHCLCQAGVLSLEVSLFFTRACELGATSLENVSAYLTTKFSVCAAFRNALRSLPVLFDLWRTHEWEHLKSSSSEMLTMYPLLRHYAQRELAHRDDLGREALSLQKACALADILLHCKHGLIAHGVAAGMLRSALSSHLQCHIAAYGVDSVRPKHHWMFDVSEMLASDMRIHDTMIIERLHLKVKPEAEDIDNTSTFEKSVLEAMFSHRKVNEGRFGRGETSGHPLP